MKANRKETQMFVLILTACTWQPTPIGLDGGPPIHPGVPVLPDRLDDDGSAVQSAQTELKWVLEVLVAG